MGNREDVSASRAMERGSSVAADAPAGEPASPSGSIIPEETVMTVPPGDPAAQVGIPAPKAEPAKPMVPVGMQPVPVGLEAGGGFDPVKSVEVVDKRGEFSTVFDNPDGTETVVLSQVPVHYRSARGAWLDVVPSFVADANDDAAVADRMVCTGLRAIGIVESRALMRRSSCQGGTRSSSVARFSI